VDGRLQAIAFVFENRSYGNRRDVESFIRAIRWIEERAGFDFMPDLDQLTQQDIESKPSAMWSIK
jgi:DNA/RNA endonuclease G (NUC1)